MKILVCISHVPDTTAKITFKDNNTSFDASGVQFIIGPYDDYALAKAVELKETLGDSVTVLNVGGPDTEPTIRKALAIGADDAIRINAEPTDSLLVAEEIAKVASAEKYDLILMGRESIDYNSGVVHGIVGSILGIPSYSPVMTLDINNGNVRLAREIEGGKEFIETKLPIVAGCQEPIAEWKIPNMRGIMTARSKPLKVLEPQGMRTSKTKVLSYDNPPAKGPVKLVNPENAEMLIDLLVNEAKVL